ncbi:hypothetical protein, partial [Corynebacterium glyciniphilum]|uniref:hypothetical protein n=1 Tax=Corynebacterium glyciniphilum TaxID=1404244 RepID=UPI0016428109
EEVEVGGREVEDVGGVGEVVDVVVEGDVGVGDEGGVVVVGGVVVGWWGCEIRGEVGEIGWEVGGVEEREEFGGGRVEGPGEGRG